MKNAIKKIGISLFGLIYGILGSYSALLGFAFAFTETKTGTKDFEENMLFVPLGFLIMIIWLAVMITAVIKLRKDKRNLLLFLIPWLIGTVALLIFLRIFN